jgi:hypothetical protein
MPENRTSQRIECSNCCHVSFNGQKYRGTIENLSISGALLKLTARKKVDFPQGSLCSLIISDDPLFIPGVFSGKVVHHRLSRIGIKFQF